MNWKEHLIIGILDAIFEFLVIWTPIVLGIATAYFLWGAEPKEWDIVGGVILITSSLAFLAMFICAIIKPIDYFKKIRKSCHKESD